MSGHAYVMREGKCRHATIFAVDNPDHAKDVARTIAEAVRDGMTVERVTTDRARQIMKTALAFEHSAKGECRRRQA